MDRLIVLNNNEVSSVDFLNKTNCAAHNSMTVSENIETKKARKQYVKFKCYYT